MELNITLCWSNTYTICVPWRNRYQSSVVCSPGVFDIAIFVASKVNIVFLCYLPVFIITGEIENSELSSDGLIPRERECPRKNISTCKKPARFSLILPPAFKASLIFLYLIMMALIRVFFSSILMAATIYPKVIFCCHNFKVSISLSLAERYKTL